MRKHSTPEITFSVPRSDRQSAAHERDRDLSMKSSKITKRISGDVVRTPEYVVSDVTKHGSSFSIAATHEVQPKIASASDEGELERRNIMSDPHDLDDSDDSDIEDHQRPTHTPRTKLEGKIKQDVVRVLTFTPRERRGVSERQKDAIADTRLLFYQDKQFKVAKPDHIDQDCKFFRAFLGNRRDADDVLVLNGAFFDIPPSCNVSYRMPSSLENRGGELLDLRQHLGWALWLWCRAGRPWSGSPRIRLMYVPGRFTDKALRECVEMS